MEWSSIKPVAGKQENDVFSGQFTPPSKTISKQFSEVESDNHMQNYFQNVAGIFQQERLDYLKKLDDCSVSREDYYKLRWEISQRETEIAELQKNLSDAHVFLYDEKQHILELHAENDNLRLLSLEDRKRAQHLLAITQPANHEFTILREAKPAILTKKGEFVAGSTDCKPREYLVPNLKGGSSVSQSADGDKSIVYGKCSQCKSSEILQTIYLPSESSDLAWLVESLKKQLNEQRLLTESIHSAYKEDRKIREEESNLQLRANKQKILDLENILKQQHEKHASLTKDYFDLRYKFKLQEELGHNSRLKLKEVERQVAQQNISARDEVEATKTAVKQESLAFVEQIRRQVIDREENLCLVREQYAAAQKMYEARLKHVNDVHSALLEKHNSLAKRYKLEIEGFDNEISLMRKSAKQLRGSLQHIKLTSRYSNDNKKLVSDPEFIALEERLCKISKQLEEWKKNH